MKIKVEYRYWENEVPKYCRKPRPIEHTAFLTVNVKEYTKADAPIAIRTKNYKSDKKWCVYRYVDGKLYIPAFSDEVSQREAFKVHLQSEYWLNSIIGYGHADPYRASYGRRSKEEERQRIIKHFHSYILIDGEVYETIREPRYVIMTFGLGHNHGIGWGTSISLDNGYNSNISKSRYFTLLQREAAIKSATDIATRRGDTKALPVEGHAPICEVLIPESIKLNPNKEHGDGDPFTNKLEALTESGLPTNIVGALGMAMAFK